MRWFTNHHVPLILIKALGAVHSLIVSEFFALVLDPLGMCAGYVNEAAFTVV
jgi:hypothetical protein